MSMRNRPSRLRVAAFLVSALATACGSESGAGPTAGGAAGTGGAGAGGAGGMGECAADGELVVTSPMYGAFMIVDQDDLFYIPSENQSGVARRRISTGETTMLIDDKNTGRRTDMFAVDATTLYALQHSDNSVSVVAAPRTGGPISVLSGAPVVQTGGIALAGDFVVFVAGDTYAVPKAGGMTTKVDSETLLASDGANALWDVVKGTNPCTFDVVAFNATTVATSVVATYAQTPSSCGASLATFGGRVCAILGADNTMHCSAINPPAQDVVVTAPVPESIQPFVMNATDAYVVDDGGKTLCGSIVRVPLDGSPRVTVAHGPWTFAEQMALSETHLYFTGGSGGIFRVPK